MQVGEILQSRPEDQAAIEQLVKKLMPFIEKAEPSIAANALSFCLLAVVATHGKISLEDAPLNCAHFFKRYAHLINYDPESMPRLVERERRRHG